MGRRPESWYYDAILTKYGSFCLGDAVHRHPPLNGLGSNTCIQDAFNLAWKVAYVHQGKASPSLLSTYTVERQPVGKSIVTRANQAFRDHFDVWDALGTNLPGVSDRRHILQELSDPSEKGKARRQQFRRAIEGTSQEFHALGVEMGQHYVSEGIYDADEPEPFTLSGLSAQNPVLYHQPTTYPGSRLPHVWLNKSVPEAQRSTIDVAGHGKFTIFTGIGGGRWKLAAKEVSSQLGVRIEAHSIGFRQDWEDVYFDWDGVRGVEESGAVLVRPDRFVAWRANKVMDTEAACADKLSIVMKSILGLGSDAQT